MGRFADCLLLPTLGDALEEVGTATTANSGKHRQCHRALLWQLVKEGEGALLWAAGGLWGSWAVSAVLLAKPAPISHQRLADSQMMKKQQQTGL